MAGLGHIELEALRLVREKPMPAADIPDHYYEAVAVLVALDLVTRQHGVLVATDAGRIAVAGRASA